MRLIKEDKGFSLVEILVVIAVMAVLAAVALPAFLTWSNSLKYKDTAWGIMSDLKLGRQLSVTNNLEYRVEFDVDGSRFRLTEGNLSSGSTAWTVTKPWKDLEDGVTWKTGSTCTGTADMNLFLYPNGSADAGVVCVQDSSGTTQITVNIDSTSGRVYFQ